MADSGFRIPDGGFRILDSGLTAKIELRLSFSWAEDLTELGKKGICTISVIKIRMLLHRYV